MQGRRNGGALERTRTARWSRARHARWGATPRWCSPSENRYEARSRVRHGVIDGEAWYTCGRERPLDKFQPRGFRPTWPVWCGWDGYGTAPGGSSAPSLIGIFCGRAKHSHAIRGSSHWRAPTTKPPSASRTPSCTTKTFPTSANVWSPSSRRVRPPPRAPRFSHGPLAAPRGGAFPALGGSVGLCPPGPPPAVCWVSPRVRRGRTEQIPCQRYGFFCFSGVLERAAPFDAEQRRRSGRRVRRRGRAPRANRVSKSSWRAWTRSCSGTRTASSTSTSGWR